jgi:hypothetical protein
MAGVGEADACDARKLPPPRSITEPLLPSREVQASPSSAHRPSLHIRRHDRNPMSDYDWGCTKAQIIRAPVIHTHKRNVMMPSVRSAAIPSPQVIATYSRRMVRFLNRFKPPRPSPTNQLWLRRRRRKTAPDRY